MNVKMLMKGFLESLLLISVNGIPSATHIGSSELNEGSEDSDHTSEHPDVEGFDIGHWRKIPLGSVELSGQSEKSGQSKGHSRGSSLHVQPKRDPRQHDDQNGGHEDEHQLLRVYSLKDEI